MSNRDEIGTKPNKMDPRPQKTPLEYGKRNRITLESLNGSQGSVVTELTQKNVLKSHTFKTNSSEVDSKLTTIKVKAHLMEECQQFEQLRAS